MSKLYTEEQLRKAIDLSYSYGLAKPNSGRLSDIPNVQNKIIETLIPIQLPTNEEIYELAKEQYPISMEKFGNEMMDGNIYFRSIFIQGVEWMRDKIKGGQGE